MAKTGDLVIVDWVGGDDRPRQSVGWLQEGDGHWFVLHATREDGGAYYNSADGIVFARVYVKDIRLLRKPD